MSGERVGGFADQHTSAGCFGLQAGRRVDHVAHGGVIGAGERADQNLASVDANAHADIGAASQFADAHVVGESCLHAQRRTYCALGVVFVRDGGAEEHEDAVTQNLVDLAAELDDYVNQPLEAGIDQPFDLLGVHSLSQRGEANQIGKQDGDDAAFLGLREAHGVTARRAKARTHRNRGTTGRARNHPRSVGDIRPQTDAVNRRLG